MKKVAILQARLNSSRLPRKVLADLAGKPVIEHIIDRLETSERLDEICIAIPEVEAENELLKAIEERKVHIARGPETNVLTRFLIAAYETHADIIVRATADNPLIDVRVMDEQIRFIEEHPATDYVFTKGLPLGVSTETFTRKTLDKLDFLARTPLMREHVTYYLVENPSPFNIVNLDPPKDLAHPEFRLTLDTPDDMEVFSQIYGQLYNGQGIVPTAEAVGFLLNHPELAMVNKKVIQVPA
jgi:spore coat polysaccharide biosynthesis protein SpsF